MTISAIPNDQMGRGGKQNLFATAVAWLWPQPLAHEDKRGGWLWLSGLIGWMWPRPLQREFDGAKARRAGLPWLMGWAWPRALDGNLSRWWKLSWLWSWVWPGRLMGPHGEICPLAPWHPALQPAVCDVTPWRARVGRKSVIAGMMMAATAMALPTFMDGAGTLDGGRINLFRDGAGGDVGAGGGQSGTGGGGTGQSGGGAGGGTGGGLTPLNPGELTQPGPQDPGDHRIDPNPPGDSGPTSGGEPGGVTFLDAPPGGLGGGPGGNGGVPGGNGFGGGGGSGDGGFGGGSGGSGGTGGGGGSGGGGGQPGDPTGGGPVPPGLNPIDPPMPPGDLPIFPTPTPGDLPPGGGGPFGPPTEQFGPPTGGGGPGGGPGGGGGGPGGGAGPAGAIPEPTTWAMMIFGFGAVGYVIRRRRVAIRSAI